jgi:hypothetical protein
MRRFVLAVICAAALGGCYGTSSYAVSGSYGGPRLALVAPGVYAVTNYDYPVFYADNYYWLYNNNRWYRSNYYSGGWRYYHAPPRAVVSIRRPYDYVRYRPHRYGYRDRYYRDPRYDYRSRYPAHRDRYRSYPYRY